MNDRELLEYAAKAAGYNIKFGKEWHDLGDPYINGRLWNPLYDDGDALRLAVKLGLNLYLDESGVQTIDGDTTIEEINLKNPYASARKGIVRAAAEIGKQLEV